MRVRALSGFSIAVMVAALLFAVTLPARADNDCYGDARATAITTTWQGDIKDIWTGCDSFGIQIRTYAGGSTYNSKFRHVVGPITNVPYSTDKILGTAPVWRACTYLGAWPKANCTSSQFSWRFSPWLNNTSWYRFEA